MRVNYLTLTLSLLRRGNKNTASPFSLLRRRAGDEVVITLLLAAVFLYTGCGCACGDDQEANIPASIIESADEIIISNTGKEFFDKYVDIDLTRSVEITPGYFMVYRLTMPDKPYINETIEFTVDGKGKLNNSFAVKGIPDCLSGECNFEVTEQQALDIAVRSGLEKGIKDLKAGFGWDEKLNKYVWRVISVSSESSNSHGSRSSGKDIVIDANSGEVLEKNDWHVR